MYLLKTAKVFGCMWAEVEIIIIPDITSMAVVASTLFLISVSEKQFNKSISFALPLSD